LDLNSFCLHEIGDFVLFNPGICGTVPLEIKYVGRAEKSAPDLPTVAAV
jgi:hypothetical protein